RRHIRDDDVARLRQSISTLLNLEMAATDEMIGIAERIRPAVITLVPERREERTTEGGLDVRGQAAAVRAAAEMTRRQGIKLSRWVAADREGIDAAAEIGAQQVELHTGEYCHACDGGPPDARLKELTRLVQATARARGLGLEVAAGHGLTRHNVGP